jgi:hypothetical protein
MIGQYLSNKTKMVLFIRFKKKIQSKHGLDKLIAVGARRAGTGRHNAHGADCLADTCVTMGVFGCLAIF